MIYRISFLVARRVGVEYGATSLYSKNTELMQISRTLLDRAH